MQDILGAQTKVEEGIAQSVMLGCANASTFGPVGYVIRVRVNHRTIKTEKGINSVS